jgi:CcmD family protein
VYEFLSQNSLYVVLLVVLVVWVGIFGYLSRIDSRMKLLEESLKVKENNL